MRKAPLNALENPVYPDIKRSPPRRIWVKPKWTVDADREATEAAIDHPELYAHTLLEEDYSASKFKYGRMNPDHTIIVNEGFRPPLEDIEDYLPISRMKVGAVGARTNPGGGYYKAQNTSLAEVNSYLSDRVKSATSMPTIEIKVGLPIEVPSIETPEDNLPTYSASAGGKYRSVSSHLAVRQMELEEVNPRTGASAGYRTNLRTSYDYDRPIEELEDLHPRVGVSAGYRAPGEAWNYEAYAPVVLDDRESIPVSAGTSTTPLFRGEGFERVRLVDPTRTPLDSGKAYRRQDTLRAPSTEHAIVDRPVVGVVAHTTHHQAGFVPVRVEDLHTKLHTGAVSAGAASKADLVDPDIYPAVRTTEDRADKQSYQVSSGRTAPPSKFRPGRQAPTRPEKSEAMSARGRGPEVRRPHGGFHQILASTR